jgi:protein phosphatase
VQTAPGDRLLLATDGLSGMLADDEIETLLAANPDPQDAARALVDAANEAGGQDNITVVVVDLGGHSAGRGWRSARASRGSGASGGARRPAALRTWVALAAWILALGLILSGVAYGTWSYARTQAYLIANEAGFVTIYRGVPGSFAGISLNWRATETTVNIGGLDPILADRLMEGIRVDSLDAAYELAEQYRAQLPEAMPGDSSPAVPVPHGTIPTPAPVP